MIAPKLVVSYADYCAAITGLGLVPNLPSRAVIVGMALFRHFNRKTGRCDPGINTIRRGTGLSRATVLRGINDLCCGENPFFIRTVHGGSNGTNKYVPNWQRLKSFAEDYDRRTGIRRPDVSSTDPSHRLKPKQSQLVTPSQSQPVTPKPIESTKRNNQAKITSEPCVEDTSQLGSDGKVTAAKQSQIKHPGFYRSSGNPKKEARNAAADRRLTKAVQQSGDVQALYLVDEARKGTWDEAVEAEAKKPGTGINILRAHLPAI